MLADLEADVDVGPAVAGADAIVFAAGAGPGSGAERKRTMDLGGAVRLIEAAKDAGIGRYVIVSSMGADHPEQARAASAPTWRPSRRPTTHCANPGSTTRSCARAA